MEDWNVTNEGNVVVQNVATGSYQLRREDNLKTGQKRIQNQCVKSDKR